MLFFSVFLSLVGCLAPLEQPDNTGIYLGAWYDRINGDSPEKIIKRVDYKPFIFWQADINISATVQSDELDQFVNHVMDTKTNAFIYLTVYPIHGFEQVTESAIKDFAGRIKQIVDKGKKVMIRYASEMNGCLI